MNANNNVNSNTVNTIVSANTPMDVDIMNSNTAMDTHISMDVDTDNTTFSTVANINTTGATVITTGATVTTTGATVNITGTTVTTTGANVNPTQALTASNAPRSPRGTGPARRVFSAPGMLVNIPLTTSNRANTRVVSTPVLRQVNTCVFGSSPIIRRPKRKAHGFSVYEDNKENIPPVGYRPYRS